MKTVLILHGIFGNSKDNWIPWLKEELEKKGYSVITPNLPNSDDPDRSKWINYLKKVTADVDFSDLTIIAHSLGVPAGLDLIENVGKKINTFISVAGFAIPYGFEPNEEFMQARKINLEKVKKLIKNIHIVHSDNDPYVTQDALSGLVKGLGVEPIVVKGAKHFNAKAGYAKLPLILDLLEKEQHG